MVDDCLVMNNFSLLFSYLDSVDSTDRMVEEDPLSEEEKEMNEESQESEVQ